MKRGLPWLNYRQAMNCIVAGISVMIISGLAIWPTKGFVQAILIPMCSVLTIIACFIAMLKIELYCRERWPDES